MERYFTAEEIEDLVDCDEARFYGDNRRWSRRVTSIVEVEGKYYSVEWDEGLTENQDNDYFAGDYPEMIKHEGVKAKRFSKWIQADTDVATVDFETDVNSMLLVTAEEKVSDAIKALEELNIESTLSLLKALEALNINEDLTVENIAVKQYFNNLRKLKETIEKLK